MGAIRRFGAKAGTAGIHLVLATQRPDEDVVPPIVKANLGGKLALQIASKVNSRIVIDDGGADACSARATCSPTSARLVRAQAPLLALR